MRAVAQEDLLAGPVGPAREQAVLPGFRVVVPVSGGVPGVVRDRSNAATVLARKGNAWAGVNNSRSNLKLCGR